MTTINVRKQYVNRSQFTVAFQKRDRHILPLAEFILSEANVLAGK